MNRVRSLACIALFFNMVFAVYHLAAGIITGSWWLFTLGQYYFILSIVRFVVMKTKREGFITKFVGSMLIAMSFPLAGTVILSVVRDRGHEFHMIVMIAIAAYSFAKITFAVINLIKSRHSTSEIQITLRNISFADSFVSIFALQRSMLVSFKGMNETEILIMNASLGTAVCITVLLLGLNLVRRQRLFFKSLND